MNTWVSWYLTLQYLLGGKCFAIFGLHPQHNNNDRKRVFKDSKLFYCACFYPYSGYGVMWGVHKCNDVNSVMLGQCLLQVGLECKESREILQLASIILGR